MQVSFWGSEVAEIHLEFDCWLSMLLLLLGGSGSIRHPVAESSSVGGCMLVLALQCKLQSQLQGRKLLHDGLKVSSELSGNVDEFLE